MLKDEKVMEQIQHADTQWKGDGLLSPVESNQFDAAEKSDEIEQPDHQQGKEIKKISEFFRDPLNQEGYTYMRLFRDRGGRTQKDHPV